MQAAINASGNPAADRPADAADLQQGQSGRRADPHAGGHLEDAAAAARCRTWSTRASRRRSRSCPASAWSASRGGQRPAVRIQANPKALAAYGLQPRRPAHRHRHRQRQPGQGQLRRPGARLDHRRQRPAEIRRRVPQPDHRLQERRAGPPDATSPTSSTTPRTCASPPGRTTRRGADPQHPAPAGRQRDRGGRPHQDSCCRSCRPRCPARSTCSC